MGLTGVPRNMSDTGLKKLAFVLLVLLILFVTIGGGV